MNDGEREQWVDNDEGLYDWFNSWKRRTGKRSIATFIRENRQEIDEAINPVLSGDKSAHHLKYR